MFVDYKEKQNAFYNMMLTTVKNNKISHAYLIETNGVSYANDLAISLAKFFLCNNSFSCDDCDLCRNFDINNYPDIKIIETDSKIIKKEQMIDLQKDFSVKPVYGKYLIYIIKDVNLFNRASANTILKFLEEPSDDIIAILLTDNVYNVIDTIVSRCQVLSLVPDLEDDSFISSIDKESLNGILRFYSLIDDVGTKMITMNDVYNFKDILDVLLKTGLYLYFDVLNCLLGRDVVMFDTNNEFFKRIVQCNEINDIIHKIDLINKFIENSKFNVNRELFIDNLIISLAS